MRPTLTTVYAALTALALAAGCTDGGNPTGTTDTVVSDTVATDTTTSDTTTVVGVPLKHRAAATMCDDERSTVEPSIPSGSGAPVDCTSHADCQNGDNGRCVGNSHDGWYCTYDLCFADADCGPSPKVCECGGGFRSDHNVCLNEGNCRVDADCGANGFCSPTLGSCGDYSGTVGYYCHTAADECVDDADCADEPSTFGAPYCAYNPTAGKWMCSSQQCVG